MRIHSRSFFIRNAAIATALLSLCHPSAAAASGSPSSDPLPRRPLLGVTAEPAPDHRVRVGELSREALPRGPT
jgi:hypothetical protein